MSLVSLSNLLHTFSAALVLDLMEKQHDQHQSQQSQHGIRAMLEFEDERRNRNRSRKTYNSL